MIYTEFKAYKHLKTGRFISVYRGHPEDVIRNDIPPLTGIITSIVKCPERSRNCKPCPGLISIDNGKLECYRYNTCTGIIYVETEDFFKEDDFKL
jgi:hypothetical protein